MLSVCFVEVRFLYSFNVASRLVCYTHVNTCTETTETSDLMAYQVVEKGLEGMRYRRCCQHWTDGVVRELRMSRSRPHINFIISQVLISTHNKYDDHTQMMSNVHECRVRCGG